MNNQFAYAQWVWGWGEKSNLEDACRTLSALDYTGIEVVTNFIDVFKNDYHEYSAVLDHYGMTTSSFYFWLTADGKADVKNLGERMDFIAKSGIHNITLQGLFIQPWDGKPQTTAQLDPILRTVSDLGDLAAKYDMVVSFHPHHSTGIMYGEEIDYIMDRTDPTRVGIAPDTAHLYTARLNACDVMEKYRDRIFSMHLKDINNAAYYLSDAYDVCHMEYSEFRELGEGSIDYDRVFSILKDINYDGWLTVELDGSRTTKEDSARISMEYLKKHW